MTKTSWSEIKTKIKELNPGFYELLDSVSPSDDLPLTIAQYGYGQTVSDSENLYFPDKNGISGNPIHTDYSPLSMVLENCFELYFKTNTTIAPWRVYSPGDILGIFWKTEAKTPYQFSPGNIFASVAGSRNAFLLSLNSNNESYQKFKKYYEIPNEIDPEDPSQHYKIFKIIAEKENSNWRATRLFFDEQWVHNINNNKKWDDVKNYFHQQVITMSSCLRNKFFLDYAMADIARTLKFKHKEYSEEIIKQILFAVTGEFPAFIPACDESAIPLDLLANAFNSFYNHINIPVFMHSVTAKNPFNTLYLSIPQNKLTIYDIKSFRPFLYLNEIKDHINKYLEAFQNHMLTKNTIYGKMHKRLQLKYYSEKGNAAQGIGGALELYNEPKVKEIYKNYKLEDSQTFPNRSQFLKAFVGFKFKQN